MSSTVHTVLGPVAADELGVVALHESLLSVVPGAEYAYDIEIDRADVFETIAAKLRAFKAAGGGTVVDSIGMFHGRDVRLYENLSRATGVHIVASTGMGPEEQLGGYFLTPQTNPPTPWPAEKFADLFGREVTEGMVVPRVERRGSAGFVTTTVTAGGPTLTDESLLRGVARTAIATGVPASIRFGADAVADLDVVLAEGVAAERVLVGGLDRRDAVGAPQAVAERGAYVGIDHVGSTDDAHLSDAERADLVAELAAAGHAARVILSSSATGAAFGHAGNDLPYETVLTSFAPLLEARGLTASDVRTIVIDNPRDLLAGR
ncbi:phosphotriesterase family protein [Microbacterium rhizophilus]|uniref:phosphotriesterase family protein n=1 Tax=Microbacterium rhizophilus TaxID=3138934 RepID=UPI0031ED632B